MRNRSDNRAEARRIERQRGWTFIEVLIGVAIVLMLTAITGIAAFRQIDKARTVTAESEVRNFSLAVTAFYLDVGRYPTETEGLAALWEKPAEGGADGWSGPYVTREIAKDPWDNDYKYTIPGDNGLPFDIISYGQDGIEGGEGSDADISAWEK